MRKICVIGVGYVGLVTGTCFADLGHQVVGVDMEKAKIEKLQAGGMPIYEPGLEEMVRRNVQAGRLDFTTSYEEALADVEFAFIAVGTPQGSGGEADLKYVRAAAQSIAEAMSTPLIIVNKSTVPIGTGDWVADIVRRHQTEPVDFAVVSNPEFLREGSAINDFMFPDRIVLGSLDPEAAAQVAQLYLSLRAPIMITEKRAGEVSVYYTEQFPEGDEGPFLAEERKLIDTVADRIAHVVRHQELARLFKHAPGPSRTTESGAHQDWGVVLDLLYRTDQNLYNQIARKMLNHLSWRGIEEAKRLLLSIAGPGEGQAAQGDENRPTRRSVPKDLEAISTEIFRIAAAQLSNQELLARLQTWVKEDRLNFLLAALESSDTTLPEIAGALKRYQHAGVDARDLSPAIHSSLKVSLIRRLLTDNLAFINVCRRHCQ